MPSEETKPDTPSERPVCTEVTQLEDKFQKLTDRLLVEGSTFEEVIETVSERGGPFLTLNAVRDHFRSSPDLQRQRVQHQVSAAASLKAALGDRDSAESELAEAAFLTGFMCLARNGSEPTLKDAERARLQRENMGLKQHVLRLQEARELKERDLLRARTAVEKAKERKLRQEVRALHDSVTRPGADRQLPPEAIRKIEEIYGLVENRPPVTAGAPEADN